jgi:hypothetical protein
VEEILASSFSKEGFGFLTNSQKDELIHLKNKRSYSWIKRKSAFTEYGHLASGNR